MTDPTPSLSERVDGATSVLVLAPSLADPDDRACIDLLRAGDPAERSVLSITVSETPEARLALWQRRVGDTLPARTAIVAAGDAADRDDPEVATAAPATVTVLSDPIDPLEFVAAISGYLGRWEDSPTPTSACVHSLTTLFDRLDPRQALHVTAVLNSRFADADAAAHYHLDPEGVDETVIRDLRPLFDAVVEHHDDGEWTVTRSEDPPPQFRSGSVPDPGAVARESDPPVLPHSFDTVVDLLAAPRRRAVLYYLASNDVDDVALDDLVEGIRPLASTVGDAPWGDSGENLLTSLMHVHLPKLEEIGVITLDREARTVRYTANPALEASIQCARRIEDV